MGEILKVFLSRLISKISFLLATDFVIEKVDYPTEEVFTKEADM